MMIALQLEEKEKEANQKVNENDKTTQNQAETLKQ